MARRFLSSEEQAIWTALTASVKPIRKRALTPALTSGAVPIEPVMTPVKLLEKPVPLRPVAVPPVKDRPQPAAVLDSGWEKRIRGGSILPEMSIDLHGHSLATAHMHLDQSISSALLKGVRVLLVVTGRPRQAQAKSGTSQRGAIRAEIGHWLEKGPYASRIASVRVAHPRHGGDGALYIILRRKK